MSPVFTPKRGITRVQVGADPRVEITPAKPYSTDDPHLVAELRANPFLTETKTAPKKKAAAARREKKTTPEQALPAEGGAS